MNTKVKIILLMLFTGLLFASQAQAQSVQFNNGSHLVNNSGVYWVFDNGNFNLNYGSTADPLVFEKVRITDDASVIVGAQTNLTINDSLNNGPGISKIILKSNATGSASLITHGKVSGRATAEKYLAGTVPSGYTVSSPMKHAPQTLFSSALGIFLYNPLVPGWAAFTSGEMEIMRGYWTKFPVAHTVVFNDTLNTGTYTYTNLYRISPFGYGNMGWNFLGNPYPSAIDWDDVIALNGGTQNFLTTTKLNSSVHIANSNGSYSSYVAGIGTNGFTGIIPAYEAFWTQVNKDYYDANNPTLPIAGAQLQLNDNVRVHATLSGGSKTTPSGIIRMYTQKGQQQDEAILRLADGGTFDFDNTEDALKIMSDQTDAPQIAMVPAGSEMMAINSIPNNPALPVSIPLTVKSSANAVHRLAFDLFAFDHDQISVHLEDKLKNSLTDLRIQDVYTYSSLVDNDNNRFVLHLGLTTGNNELGQNEITVYSYDNSIYISNLKEQSTFTLYNMLGQVIYTKIITDNNCKIDFNVARGYYMAHLTGNKTNISQKVLLNSNHY